MNTDSMVGTCVEQLLQELRRYLHRWKTGVVAHVVCDDVDRFVDRNVCENAFYI